MLIIYRSLPHEAHQDDKGTRFKAKAVGNRMRRMPGVVPVRLQDFVHSGQPEMREKIARQGKRAVIALVLLLFFAKPLSEGPLIHCFTCNGAHLLLDADSGAVHRRAGKTSSPIILKETRKRLLKRSLRRTTGEVAAAWDELETLEKSGALNADYGYGEAYLKRPGVVKSLCLNVSHDCNLRCAYCFASTGDFGGRGCSCRRLRPRPPWASSSREARQETARNRLLRRRALMNWDVVKNTVAYGRARRRPASASDSRSRPTRSRLTMKK